MNTETFGQWLQRQVQRRQWSQAELSRRAGVSGTSISHWIAGRTIPDTESCDKLAEALFLSRDEVMARAGLRPVEHEDSEVVREFMGLLRRIDWTPDRVNSVRAILSGMAAFALDGSDIQSRGRTVGEDEATRFRF